MSGLDAGSGESETWDRQSKSQTIGDSQQWEDLEPEVRLTPARKTLMQDKTTVF